VTLEGNGFAATTGSAVGKTIVASALTAGRRDGKGGSEPLAEACERKPANSFPAREDLDISRHEDTPSIYPSETPRSRYSRTGKGMAGGGGKSMPLRTDRIVRRVILRFAQQHQ